MKGLVDFALKLGVTLAIFVGIFLEFGGGWVPVQADKLRPQVVRGEQTARAATVGFAVANPAYPGVVGRLRARLAGAELPPPVVPSDAERVCVDAAERPVFVQAADGTLVRFKPSRHCGEGGLATVYRKDGDTFTAIPFADATGIFWFRKQGFQLVPAEFSDLWAEIRHLELAVFLPWFLAAMAVKLVGIFANVWRWQILLRGQGIELGFGFLTNTYFIGRYFGIVTPSTMGLDAWRLYETIRLTRRPVECTTTLVVERVIGLVGLFAVILLFMPFAGRLTQGQSFGELVGAMKVPLAGALATGVLLLLQPTWFRGAVRLVPNARIRGFVGNVIDAATAYSSHRAALLVALAMAVVGQVTTTLMYFCNAMSLATQNVHTSEVLFASAVMTFGTFVAPSASGEGVRELVFVWLLGSKAGAAKAFLIGNLGFWIEKIPLSVPGGGILLLRRDPSLHAVTREDLERVRREAAAG
jgi:glycosyltransferase 2 family protein